VAQKIALIGGSFDPPGIHHGIVAAAAALVSDRAIVYPCGDDRRDGKVLKNVAAKHRGNMATLAFWGMLRVEVDQTDIVNEIFTPTWKLAEQFQKEGDVWLVVGTDTLSRQENGLSVMENTWERGEEVWRDLQFLVAPRPGYPIEACRMPPCVEILNCTVDGASKDIRELIKKGECFERLVVPDVAAYIRNFRLYGWRPNGEE